MVKMSTVESRTLRRDGTVKYFATRPFFSVTREFEIGNELNSSDEQIKE